MTVIVRDFRPADAEDRVRVRRTALPYMVTTPEQVVLDLATARPDKRYRMLVAEEDGEVAAFALAETGGVNRYRSGMTGTRRAYRGRRPAKLAKNGSLHRARDAGYTDAYTGNDAGNRPMPAIDRRLGDEICTTEVRHVRRFD
ncbi:hypothetical protein ABZ434_15825 [Streptomyces sp. NPDC005761]|uniref:GNAT family N-acetyltransferase n=1 Tax=Streptomyces sp. NPDC005761 TaxID=3157066 RepID=UPI0033CB679F